jgi:long-chain acyl-CoA synthetase
VSPVPRSSILEYLEDFARNKSDIAYVQRSGYRMKRWKYHEVAEGAARFGRELESLDVGRGDHVLLWGENSAEWVAAFFGCLLRGAVVVPMHSTATPDFAQRVAQQVGAKLVICSRKLLSQVSATNALALEDLPVTVARHSASLNVPLDVGRSDKVQVIFTSGATAEPKGVVITHGNILANLEPFEAEIRKYRRYERLFHPIRFLCLLPLSHVFGQFLGIFIPQLIGGTVVFGESLNPSQIMHTIRSERISVLVAVPRMMQSLKEKVERDYEQEVGGEWLREQLAKADRSVPKRWWTFRGVHKQLGWKFWALVSGGATLDSATEEFWRKLGFAVIQGYGLTETTSLISVNHPFRQGSGSVGKVLPGREMKLDSSGEILVRGEGVAAGYWQGQQLSPVLGEDGWFHTGDLGELDSEGRLHFKGRKKQVIVTREGINIYPEDLEGALRRQPEIRDCAVVPLEHEGNAEPVALLILRDGAADPEAVIQRANATLDPNQKVRKWFVWYEPDFPRVATQKVRTDLLQQAAQERFGARRETQAAGDSLSDFIARMTRKPVGQISPNAHLEDDLNLSSLDRVELVSALEDRYKIDLSDEVFSEVETVGQLEAALRRSAPRESSYPYPRWAQRRIIRAVRFLVYYLLTWPATFALLRPRISGREHLRGISGPLLVISNHITYIDIGLILAALPARLRHRLATAMGGEALLAMRNPSKTAGLMRRWAERVSYYLVVSLFNVFPLPQRSDFRESFRFAGELVDQGRSVLVFPEGERTPDGQMHDFRAGVGLLATRLGVPVLPVKIEGLYDLKVEHKYFAPGRVSVKIGEPVSSHPNDDPARVARDLESRVAAL